MVFCLVFHDVFNLCIGFFETIIDLKDYGPVVVVATSMLLVISVLLSVVEITPGMSRISVSSLISMIVPIVIAALFLLWFSTSLTISFFLVAFLWI